ncbi:MAG: class I SAM-dependent DNA methyltransferase, partial [Candidatus Moranbacteria bacterium]|nr:class I SAM-dependent DNA methyltransferase [Candidatus Moranbacteria bacterium]
NSGFDAIIGNPPYGAQFSKEELSYFKSNYQTAVWRGESYLLFIEQGLKLLSNDGMLGLIIPDTLLNLSFTQPARELLLRNSVLNQVIGLPSRIFSGATVDTLILLTQKTIFNPRFHPSNILIKLFDKKEIITKIENPKKQYYLKAEAWFNQNDFNIHADQNEILLLNKIEGNRKTIKDLATMHSGIKAYSVGRGTPIQTEFIRKSKPYTSTEKLGEDWSPFFDGKHIGRYIVYWKQNNWIKYGANLAEPRNQENFLGEKILIRKITGKRLIATYVPNDSYCNTLLHVLKIKDQNYSYFSLLAYLNSTLIGWYFRKRFQISDDDTFPQIMIRDILQFPFPDMNKNEQMELNKQVDKLLHLNEQIKHTRLPSEIDQIQSHIQHCEARIDEIIYRIFDLTDDEIQIISGS